MPSPKRNGKFMPHRMSYDKTTFKDKIEGLYKNAERRETEVSPTNEPKKKNAATVAMVENPTIQYLKRV